MTPVLRLLDATPAAIAPTPSSSAMIEAVCAVASCSRRRDRCPPARWPVSCASTPMISFGVLESYSAPTFTKMRRPSITKALNDALVDQHDLHVLLRQAGDAQDRRGVVAQQLLDLGVADDRQAAGGFRLRERRLAADRERDGRRARDRRAKLASRGAPC